MLVKSTVKYIQSLGQKKFRELEGVFIAEGPRIVKELLEDETSEVKQVYGLKDWIDENKKYLTKTEVIEITESELERISQLTTPNKVIAIVQQYNKSKDIITKGSITLALDSIQDPGNLGTIIRIADWYGVEQIIFSTGCADIYNPKVVQATMGSIARVKFFYTDLQHWLAEQKDVCIYATTLEGQDVYTVKKIQEGIIIFGNESRGISPEVLQLANVKFSIPKKGNAESLNAAVAAGIILSHICCLLLVVCCWLAF